MELFQKNGNPSSKLLIQCTSYAPEGSFPNLTEYLEFFEEAFDHELAKKEGCIIPKSSGVDADYDAVMEELKNIEKETKEYLSSQCRYFGVNVSIKRKNIV